MEFGGIISLKHWLYFSGTRPGVPDMDESVIFISPSPKKDPSLIELDDSYQVHQIFLLKNNFLLNKSKIFLFHFLSVGTFIFLHFYIYFLLLWKVAFKHKCDLENLDQDADLKLDLESSQPASNSSTTVNVSQPSAGQSQALRVGGSQPLGVRDTQLLGAGDSRLSGIFNEDIDQE